jgi:hypothetical protein
MSLNVNTNIRTLVDVFTFMAPFAGGSIPSVTDQEYTDWKNWVINKQEEFARRAFWRRCLTRETITLGGETTLLPDRFNRPNALFMLIVDNVDWNETPNDDEQYVFIEMVTDSTSDDFGKWQMRFENEVDAGTEAVIWFFANPPQPDAETDLLLLPGDMIGYAALSEYFRTKNAVGSQDDANAAAENRFQEYLAMEVIPDKSDLLKHSENSARVDRLNIARSHYTTRANRNRS